jgi:hypothetical protein
MDESDLGGLLVVVRYSRAVTAESGETVVQAETLTITVTGVGGRPVRVHFAGGQADPPCHDIHAWVTDSDERDRYPLGSAVSVEVAGDRRFRHRITPAGRGQ